jgi:hypothetical protein
MQFFGVDFSSKYFEYFFSKYFEEKVILKNCISKSKKEKINTFANMI